MTPLAKSLSISRGARGGFSPSQANFPPISANIPVPRIPRRFERLPPWDREVDVTFHKDPLLDKDERVPVRPDHTAKQVIETRRRSRREYRNQESLTYAAIISILNYQEKRKASNCQLFRQVVGGLHLRRRRSSTGNTCSSFFKLPDKIRQRIWHYVVRDGAEGPPKPVCLQAFTPFLKAVWLPDEFQTTNDLFYPIQSAMSACFAMRADLLGYVLTTHRFHFTFSPHVRQKTCPEIFGWIDKYSHLMQFITIELDLSKLGFGPDTEAPALLPGNLHINTVVGKWVDVQLARRSMPIQSLVLLARRYHGIRPITGRPFSHPAGDYAAVAPLLRLSGRIDTLRLRIAGFNASTSDHILAALFPDVKYKAAPEILKHCYRAGISTIWPFLPGQASVHRDGHYGKPVAPKETERMAQLTSLARRPSLARRQITRLKEMLAANEEQMRSSDASIDKPPTPPLSTWSTRRNTRDLKLHVVSEPAARTSNSFEMGSREELLSEEQKRISRDSVKSFQSIQSESSGHTARGKMRDSGLGFDVMVEVKRQSATTFLERKKSFTTNLFRRPSRLTKRQEE